MTSAWRASLSFLLDFLSFDRQLCQLTVEILSTRVVPSALQELEKLEPELDMLGSMKGDLEAKVSALSSGGDFDALLQTAERLAKLVNEIDSKTERWMALAERAEAHA